MARKKRKGIMLAYPADNGRIQRMGPCFGQPKLRGERCWVDWASGHPILTTSYGNHFHIPHIHSAIRTHPILYNIYLDGEIYVHGWPQERINSAANRKVNHDNPDTALLEYHVFDIKARNAQDVRIATLVDMFEKHDMPSCLKLVPTYFMEPTLWGAYAQMFLNQGYEGLIFRKPDAPYYEKKNVAMLKYKPTETDAFTIDRVNEAISQEGVPKGMAGSFTVHDKEEVVFDVSAGKVPHNKRILYWEIRDQLVGRPLVTKHDPVKTKNGKPTCAVAVRVEGM